MDTLARDLKGLAYTNVSIVGHTDRIGSDTYNQKLSESRAKAVKQYLVEAGIPSDKITNQGVGETQPVTTDCKGEKANPKLVSCLAPDRRVSVQVSGTK